jgi:hypothetical protein
LLLGRLAAALAALAASATAQAMVVPIDTGESRLGMTAGRDIPVVTDAFGSDYWRKDFAWPPPGLPKGVQFAYMLDDIKSRARLAFETGLTWRVPRREFDFAAWQGHDRDRDGPRHDHGCCRRDHDRADCFEPEDVVPVAHTPLPSSSGLLGAALAALALVVLFQRRQRRDHIAQDRRRSLPACDGAA